MTSQLENKSTIAKNGDAAGDGKNQTIDIGITEILLGYAIKNPIGTLSSCALIFGGLLLLIYFINIQFLPDITLESAISILYSISFLGSLFIAMFAIFMAIPILISKIIWEDYEKKGALSAPGVILYSGVAIMTSFVVAIISPVLPKFILWIFIGSLFVFSVCVTMSSLLLAHSQEEEYSKLPICKKIKRPYGIFKDLKKCSGKSSIPLAFSIIKSSIYLVFRIISTFVCQVMLFVFVFLMFLKFRGSSYDGWVLFLVAVFFLFGVAISIVIYSISWIGAIKVIISSGFLLTFISFVVMDSIGAPSIFAVNRLGIGELNAARLVLSGKGCKQLNLALGGKHCEEVADDQPTSLCPVTLRSRIGSQVLIEVAPVTLTVDEKDPSKKTLRWHDKENPRQRVVLDRSVLLAWSRLPGFPFSTEGGPYCKENPQDCEKPASSIAYGANKSNSFTLLQKELLARCGMP